MTEQIRESENTRKQDSAWPNLVLVRLGANSIETLESVILSLSRIGNKCKCWVNIWLFVCCWLLHSTQLSHYCLIISSVEAERTERAQIAQINSWTKQQKYKGQQSTSEDCVIYYIKLKTFSISIKVELGEEEKEENAPLQWLSQH